MKTGWVGKTRKMSKPLLMLCVLNLAMAAHPAPALPTREEWKTSTRTPLVANETSTRTRSLGKLKSCMRPEEKGNLTQERSLLLGSKHKVSQGTKSSRGFFYSGYSCPLDGAVWSPWGLLCGIPSELQMFPQSYCHCILSISKQREYPLATKILENFSSEQPSRYSMFLNIDCNMC